MIQESFSLQGRNPDVLTCIANLSSDAVFTPPEFANQMLDTLTDAWAKSNDGANIWEDSSATFLDPFTKSGVFLREIVTRLTNGLAAVIPDREERVDHILTKQVYGIGTETLTALLARRSVYCSKYANGPHSIAKSFATEHGNIWFERTEHTWTGGRNRVITTDLDGKTIQRTTDGRCKYCGAPQAIFDRDEGLESHAYPFIHAEDIKVWLGELFGVNMHFDVIIGNPPYQMTGGAGGSSDSSIYHLFVEQAMRLEPRYLSMVVPSRWMAGGRGLGEFRRTMLSEKKLRTLADFPDSSDAFPGVQIKGGVCHFLWDADYNGLCTVTRHANGDAQKQQGRDLGEFDVFIRDERSITILRKVLAMEESSLLHLVSGDTPFGLATNFGDYSAHSVAGMVPIHLISKGKRTLGFVQRDRIKKNTPALDTWKALVPEAYGAGESFPHQILGKMIIAEPPSACTQSYLVVGPFEDRSKVESFSSYYQTRLFRFLVSLRKITQHALRSTYTWVPQQSWDRSWTDEELYKKYGITEDEIVYIESIVRSMDAAGE